MNNKQALIVRNIPREDSGLLGLLLNYYNIGFDVVDLGVGTRFPDPRNYFAVFVFGGPDSANDTTTKMQEELQRVNEATDAGIPYLGVCLGMQVLIKANGGEIYKNNVKEIGWRDLEGSYFEVELTDEGKADPLFEGTDSKLKIFHFHSETVRLADGMKLLATGEYCKNQVVKIGNNAYGIQGHFELTPKMFDEWRTHDSDLIFLDQINLQNDYNKLKAKYEINGRKIFTNFLRLARLIK